MPASEGPSTSTVERLEDGRRRRNVSTIFAKKRISLYQMSKTSALHLPRVTKSAKTSAATANVLRELNENGSVTDIASAVGAWCFGVVLSFKSLMAGVVSWRKLEGKYVETSHALSADKKVPCCIQHTARSHLHMLESSVIAPSLLAHVQGHKSTWALQTTKL